jgi:hypothetical protein
MDDICLYILACSFIAGGATGLWHVLGRVHEEQKANRSDRNFSYYDVLDAVYHTIWGGAIGACFTIAAPIAVPLYCALRKIRQSEIRDTE